MRGDFNAIVNEAEKEGVVENQELQWMSSVMFWRSSLWLISKRIRVGLLG